MTKRRRGRIGQTHTASPRLPSYDLPPASEVTIQRTDGSTETQPAQNPKRTPQPQRRRGPSGPLVCARCGYPIESQAATSTEHGSRGKPVHPPGECVKTPLPDARPGEYHHVPAPVLTVGDLLDVLLAVPRNLPVTVLLPQRPTCHPDHADDAIRFRFQPTHASRCQTAQEFRIYADFVADIYNRAEHLLHTPAEDG